MALQIEKTYRGVPCNYHRISSVTVDKDNRKTSATLASYASADARSADSIANAIFTQPLQFDGVPDGECVAWVYDQLKAAFPDDWGVAQDVSLTQLGLASPGLKA